MTEALASQQRIAWGLVLLRVLVGWVICMLLDLIAVAFLGAGAFSLDRRRLLVE